jgi:hypothetical protein
VQADSGKRQNIGILHSAQDDDKELVAAKQRHWSLKTGYLARLRVVELAMVSLTIDGTR